MAGREKVMQEIVRGLEGLITLNEWELTLLQDLRAKAENSLGLGPDPSPERGPGQGRDRSPGPDSGRCTDPRAGDTPPGKP